MIVVDTSAWVELLRATGSPVHRRLRVLLEREPDVAVTEVVVMELLAGARSAVELQALRARLLACEVFTLDGLGAFEGAADLARACRSAGEPVRHLVDCLIAIAAIAHDAPILTADRDFETIARHSTLELVRIDD